MSRAKATSEMDRDAEKKTSQIDPIMNNVPQTPAVHCYKLLAY